MKWSRIFFKKFLTKRSKVLYLCRPLIKGNVLPHGVKVAHRFLVPFVLVRIQVGQHSKGLLIFGRPFFILAIGEVRFFLL